MTEQDKTALIQGIDMQISNVSNAVLQSQVAEEKAVGRETIAYLNTLIAKVGKLEEPKEKK